MDKLKLLKKNEQVLSDLRTLTDLVGETYFNINQIIIESNKLLFNSQKINLVDEVTRFEVQLIKNALLTSFGCQKKAAKSLGLKNTTLNGKIKRYGIDVKSFRRDRSAKEEDFINEMC